MYEFTDEYGNHSHTVASGPPYDPSAPITCAACIVMLDSRMSVWLDTLTERHDLAENFWQGYKFSWS